MKSTISCADPSPLFGLVARELSATIKILLSCASGGLTDASKIIPSAHNGDRRRSDDVASIITSDSLAAIRKKFHVPNDVLIIAPKRTDRAHAPPQEFVAVYEMTMRAGEGLTDASKIIPSAHDGDRRRSDDVASIITSDSLAAIRKKFHVPNDVLIIAPRRTNRAHAPPQRFVAVYEMTLCTGLRFPPAPESLDIFKAFGVNEWDLLKKWDKLKELPSSLHVGEEDILRILNFPNKKSLQQELCYISRCVMEKYLFKVGLSIQAGRSNATQLKKSEKVHEITSTAFKHSASHPSEGQRVTNSSSLKKRKTNHKVILPRGDGGSKEAAHLPTIDTISLDSDIKARPSRIHIPEDVVEEFKKSATYHREIQSHVQEAYEKLFDVEVKDLERQSLEEGFTGGFLKGVRLVHRKTGVDIEGLTPSQAS
ncbi:hypothetical protein IEQ34_026718 [Dendrobium chrysotoxum]|uniref:Uncharacterized protein n=1 Tax=Dendrobium chrysotoxum TaxID=161865 RepID=A0AAV7FLC3_DENCH|nr:hypothetical protein IEQ34_026718 [Dendrobium chrysotoxum]